MLVLIIAGCWCAGAVRQRRRRGRWGAQGQGRDSLAISSATTTTAGRREEDPRGTVGFAVDGNPTGGTAWKLASTKTADTFAGTKERPRPVGSASTSRQVVGAAATPSRGCRSHADAGWDAETSRRLGAAGRAPNGAKTGRRGEPTRRPSEEVMPQPSAQRRSIPDRFKQAAPAPTRGPATRFAVSATSSAQRAELELVERARRVFGESEGELDEAGCRASG